MSQSNTTINVAFILGSYSTKTLVLKSSRSLSSLFCRIIFKFIYYIYIYIYIYIYKFTRHVSTSDLPIPEAGPETFLAPSADKQTGEGDIYGATGVLRESPKCSNCEQ